VHNERVADEYTGRHWQPHNFQVILPKPMIQGLCYEHFSEAYGKSKRVRIETNVRSKFPVFATVRHPSEMETYTVRIQTSKCSFMYVVGPHGEPIEHFKICGGKMTHFALPNWFGDVQSGMHEPDSTDPFVIERNH
jgi:hypothetical protein